jgi:D-alanine-D-alanine ligase-like ATP-grasp enzyme
MTPPRPLVPVFAPYTTVPESPKDNDYDSPEFREDVRSWFARLPVDWEWVPVTTENVGRVVEDAARAARERPVIVLNLCDGTDDNGYPGLSVLRALESAGLAASGVDSHFYEISTSKLAMKRRFAAAGVATSPWVEIVDINNDVRRAASELGWPLFLKPDISGGSVGISLRSRARNHREAVDEATAMLTGMQEGESDHSGIYAEMFLSGREFTALVQSTGESTDAVRVYPPAERIFHSALPVEERFLSYERYWQEYEHETPPPPGEPFYRHVSVEPELAGAIADTARRAYLALDGLGYARVDMRQDGASGEITVLEANANCGLTWNDETSAGAVLGLAGIPLPEFVRCALREAWLRRHAGTASPV